MIKIRWIPAVLLTSGLAIAQEPAEQSAAQREYETLVAAYSKESNAAARAQRLFYASEEYTRLTEAGDRDAITKRTAELPQVDRKAHAEAFLAAAKRYEGTDAALPFMLWLLIDSQDPTSMAEAAKMILADHKDSPELLAVARRSYLLSRIPADNGTMFRKALLESPHPLVSAWMRYQDLRTRISSPNASAQEREQAQKTAEQIAAAHPGTLLAKTIMGPRFVEERLKVGMEAPDIVGEDLDRVPFRLSDYRGKVVVLDFWGDW